MTASMLDQLEAQLSTLPTGATKHDMEPGFAVMAEWIRGLDRDSRAKVKVELLVWLKDSHRWHSRAVMQFAFRLGDRDLLESAIREARERGVHDVPAEDQHPPWLQFQLTLLSAISRWPGDPGKEARAYLRELRENAVKASSYSRRLLGIRAWFTECLLEPAERRKDCLSAGLDLLRKWRDPRLLRSGLSLLHAYFASTRAGVSALREVLTDREFAIAFPEAVAC